MLSEYGVLAAFWLTIKLTLLSALGALVIGTFVAVMRVSPIAVMRSFGTAYVTVVRNTPLTLIVFFCVAALALLVVPGPAVLYIVARSVEREPASLARARRRADLHDRPAVVRGDDADGAIDASGRPGSGDRQPDGHQVVHRQRSHQVDLQEAERVEPR